MYGVIAPKTPQIKTPIWECQFKPPCVVINNNPYEEMEVILNPLGESVWFASTAAKQAESGGVQQPVI